MADKDFFNHPIFERHAVLLETPMIKHLTKQLEDFLWGNAVGCCFHGDYRIGKSWAIYFIYKEGLTIGEAVNQAKQALAKKMSGASDVLLGWQILGDPALVINAGNGQQ